MSMRTIIIIIILANFEEGLRNRSLIFRVLVQKQFFTDTNFAVEVPATTSISDELKISREKIFVALPRKC